MYAVEDLVIYTAFNRDVYSSDKRGGRGCPKTLRNMRGIQAWLHRQIRVCASTRSDYDREGKTLITVETRLFFSFPLLGDCRRSALWREERRERLPSESDMTLQSSLFS